MTHNIKRIFLVAFIVSIGALFLWTSSMRPSILVIHSYSAKTPWVKNVNTGIRKILKERTFYHSYYHYMDIKSQPDKAYTEDMKKKTIEVIEALKPDFLILVDDMAQELIGTNYINDEDIQVVYCGVRRRPKDYGYDKAKNITGVHVSLPVQILDDLLTFNIDEGDFDHEIHLTPLSDNTITSQEDNDVLQAYKKWSKVRLKKPIKVKTFKEWRAKIKAIRGRHDVILISNYQALLESEDSDKFVPAKELIHWTIENSKVPIVGLYGSFVREGGFLSVAPSALEQGEKAARIVENLIENDVYIHQLTPQNSNHFLIYMREVPEHKPYKFVVPSVYEAFARAMHHYFD